MRFLKVEIILLQSKVSASSSDSPRNSFDISSLVVWFTFFKFVTNSSSASESICFCLLFFAFTLLFAATETLVFLVVVHTELLGHSKNVVDDDDDDDDDNDDDVDGESPSNVYGVISMLLCVSFLGSLS